MSFFKKIGSFFTETLPKAFSKDGAVTNFVQDYVPGGGLVTSAVHGIAGNRDYAEYAAVKGLSSTVSTGISAVGLLGGPAGAVLAGGLAAVSSNLIEGAFKGLMRPAVKDKLNDITPEGVATSFGIGAGVSMLGPLGKAVKGTGVAKAIGTFASKALKPASGFVSKLTKPITTAVSKAGNSLSQTASNLYNAVAKPFRKLLPAAKPTVPKGEIRSVTDMLEGVAKKKAPTIADFADDIDLARIKKKVTDKVVENPMRGAVFEADPTGAASALHMRKSDKSSRGPKDAGASLPAASGDGSAGASKPGNKPVLVPAVAVLTTVIFASLLATQCAQKKPVPPAVVATPPLVPAIKPLAPVPAEPVAARADLAPPAAVIAPVVLQPMPSVPVPLVAPPAEPPRKAAIEVARPPLPPTLARPDAALDRPAPRPAPPVPPASVEPPPRPTLPLQQPIRPAQPAGLLQPPVQAPYERPMAQQPMRPLQPSYQPPMGQQPMPPVQSPRPPQPPYQAPYQPPLVQQPMRPLQPSYQPPMGQQPMPPAQPPRPSQPPYQAPYQPPTAQQPMRPQQPSYQPPVAQQPMPPVQPQRPSQPPSMQQPMPPMQPQRPVQEPMRPQQPLQPMPPPAVQPQQPMQPQPQKPMPQPPAVQPPMQPQQPMQPQPQPQPQKPPPPPAVQPPMQPQQPMQPGTPPRQDHQAKQPLPPAKESPAKPSNLERGSEAWWIEERRRQRAYQAIGEQQKSATPMQPTQMQPPVSPPAVPGR